jgi:predicted  nucleic acid-binding Zn-ribbon protein
MDDPGKEKQEKLDALEREKEAMIRQYMALQDQADEVNEQIYHVCCGVEALNLQIQMLKEEMRLAALKAAGPQAPANGKHAPPPPNERTA